MIILITYSAINSVEYDQCNFQHMNLDTLKYETEIQCMFIHYHFLKILILQSQKGIFNRK